MAPTTTERDLILRAGRRMLLVSVISIGFLFLLIKAFAGGSAYLIAWVVWFIVIPGRISSSNRSALPDV